MPPLVVWVTRVQAVALVGLAIALVVLATTSHRSLSVGFLVAEIVVALLGAALFGFGPRHRRGRAPVLVFEIIAVLVAGQLVGVHRPLVAAVVGLPALAAVVAIFLAARETDG